MEQLATVFKALSDESRLRILNLLFISGELCVCDIESTTGFTQTKVSRHLLYLKNAGLLDSRQQGLWMLYKIANPKNKEHQQLLDCLKTILDSNPTAQRDGRELAKSIKKGCCTTFSTIKPNQIPAILELN
jgi:ArsR family transcriptional regulator, arsenate/arsenite/antimonite-responsive transcriptional repressor